MNSNQEVAKIVIGKILHKPEYYFTNYQILHHKLFLDYVDENLFKRIKKKLDQSLPVDEAVLISEIDDPNLITRVTEYSEAAYTRADFLNCISILDEASKKHQLKLLGSDLVSMSNNGKPVMEILEEIQNKLSKINLENKSNIADSAVQLSDYVDDIDKRMNTDGPLGVPSGIQSVDKFTGCWQNGELVIIAARPSMGKTAIATNMADNSAKMDYPSVVFSYEMGYKQIYNRIVSSNTGIDNKWIMKGAITTDDRAKIQDAVNDLSNIPLYIDECNDSSLTYLSNKIRQYVMSEGVKIVYVDYLQLITNRIYTKSREQEISSISRTLKALSKELQIPVIALSKLNRGVEQRPDKRRMLSDLRESGAIEQDADIVSFLYRPEYYGIYQDADGNDTAGMTEYIIAKGRSIGTGTIKLMFKKETTKFEE